MEGGGGKWREEKGMKICSMLVLYGGIFYYIILCPSYNIEKKRKEEKKDQEENEEKMKTKIALNERGESLSVGGGHWGEVWGKRMVKIIIEREEI